MKAAILAAVLGFLTAPLAAGHTYENCVPTQADPSTYIILQLENGRRFYWEERGNPLGTDPPVPFSGFLLSDGTWLWEEANALEGLQRGGVGPFGSCFPPPPLPCFDAGYDVLYDVNCGFGPDVNLF